MNKLTKVGFSALCGSLAAISAANAGELTVTGGADMTYVSKGTDVTGNPIGIGSNLSFKGSGELDNGWTFDLTVANTNANAYSAANITLDMGGLGKLNFNQGDSGNGVSAFDDKMPTAWEEAWGAGLTTGIRTIVGSGASQNVMYTTPTVLGTTITLTYAPQYGAADTSDKGTSGVAGGMGSSYDGTININPSLGTEILSGLNVFVAASTMEEHQEHTTENDKYHGTAGVTYSLGPVAIGAQVTGEYTGEQSAADYNGYKGDAFGISFNVNDDLSVSYNKWDQRKSTYNDEHVPGGPNDRNIEVTSWQVAYTMGGASMRLAEVNANNAGWTAANDTKATVVSLGLAF